MKIAAASAVEALGRLLGVGQHDLGQEVSHRDFSVDVGTPPSRSEIPTPAVSTIPLRSTTAYAKPGTPSRSEAATRLRPISGTSIAAAGAATGGVG
jgi:hypothetical protein